MKTCRKVGLRVLCGACLAAFAFVPNPALSAQDAAISAPAAPRSPATSGSCSGSDTTACPAQAERELRTLQAQLQQWAAEARSNQAQYQAQYQDRARELSARMVAAARTVQDARIDQPRAIRVARAMPPQMNQAGDEGWLGVEIGEVTAQEAKDLKLSSERGVVVSSVEQDSPAAKAGLRRNDVVTRYNGEDVEGAEQFRRLVRETPPHRTATLTISRDGHSQNLSVELGDGAQAAREQFQRAFRGMDNIRLAMPQQEWSRLYSSPNGIVFASPTPILGITAEDLSGQLGAYFGAPHDEGVLVRDVRSQSPSEKAGMKAGDVIVSANGNPVRSVADLRAQLPARSTDKPVNVAIGLLRKGAKVDVTVTIEPLERPESPALHSAQL